MEDSDPSIQALDAPVSLRAQIAHELRALLVAGHLKSGVTYSVPSLAERFGVSATPTREAVLDLVNEGLLEPLRNKGFRVVDVTDSDLDEIIEMRVLLEAPMIAKIAGTAGKMDLEPLSEKARHLVQLAEDGDVVTYIEVDRQFHLDLLALGGNRRLVEGVERLRAQTRLTGLDDLARSGSLAESAKEHLAMLAAVRGGDSESAQQVTARHILHARGIWTKNRDSHRRDAANIQ